MYQAPHSYDGSITLQMEHSFSFLKFYMKVTSHWEFAWE